MGAVELSLFYFLNDTAHEGYVLWGEGIIRDGPASVGVHSEALGDGLQLMRVRGPFDDVARRLGEKVFPYRRGRGVTDNIHFAFARRPPVMTVPPHPVLQTTGAGRLHHFVRAQKAAALGITQRPSELRDRAQMARLFESLERHVGVDFRAPKFAPLLGDVVIVEDACLRDAPVELEGIKPGRENAPEALRLTIDPRVAGAELMVNVRLTGSDNAVLDDVLVHWQAGMPTEFVLPVNQRFGGAEVRAWRDGRLVWQTDLAFILEVGLNMSLVGRTVLLQDRLTELLQGSIQAGLAPASLMATTQRVVQQSHGNRSLVGANLREPWRAAALGAAGEVYALSPPPAPPHEYFPQGGHGRARAIQAFVSQLEAKNAFLVDPFFDALGAEALLPRVSRDANLTVLTSLPETFEVERLRQYLGRAAPFLPFKLKVYRVTRHESKEQAFHDRYLVMMDDEQPPRGLLLSNSFSGAARQYPLVVAEMSGATTAAVIDDIEMLLAHRSIETIWPPAAEPREAHDAFGKSWRFYLQRLLPCSGRPVDEWLRAAKRAGWLDIDSEGNPRWSTTRQSDVLARVLGRAPAAGWLRRLSWRRRGPRLPVVGLRVAALGERAARGLDVTPAEVAARLRRAAGRDLEAFLRANFRHPEQRDRRRAWLDVMAVHQAMAATEASLAIVRIGLAFWADTHAAQDLHQPWGRTFVYRVLLTLEPERAFRVGVELADPDFIVAVLDPWDVAPWRLPLTRAAIHSRSPMIRALGAQSLVAPRGRGNFSHVPKSPPPELLGRAMVVLALLDRPTAALCALEWGLRSTHADVRRALAECFVERYADIGAQDRKEACAALLHNERFLEAVASAPSLAGRGGELADDVGRALEVAVTTDHGVDNPLEAADAVARILLTASGFKLELAKERVRVTLGVEVAKARSTPLSPFRRHPDWHKSVVRLAWAQLLFLRIHAQCETEDGAESIVSFSLVSEVSSTLLARILVAHVPGLGALLQAS